MTNFDPYDFAGHLTEAQQTVLREQAEQREQRFIAKRPMRFAAEGDLHPDIHQWCRRVYRGTEHGDLVLVGGVGAGKTWSLWKLGQLLIQNGWRGRYEVLEAYDLKDVMRDRDRDQDARVLVNTWTQADLLAIDDLGVVGMHNWDSDNLSRLINDRWKHGLPTVVTTNVADLKPLVGPRAASRMQDEATFVAMGDNDRRRNK